MTETQSVRKRLLEMIVDVVSNDYESYQLVVDEVRDWANEENVSCTIDDIKEALADSIAKGYVRVYKYSQSDSGYKEMTLDKNDWASQYFYATTAAKGLLAR